MLAPPLQQVDRTYVRFRNRRLTYFGGCDYFRLSSHPEVLKAVRVGLQRYGLSVAASRKTTGNHQLYEKLEQKLAGFFGAPGAVIVSNGYASNLAVAQTLAGAVSRVLLEEKAHASLRDAAQFFHCPIQVFRHKNADDLQRKIRAGRAFDAPIILTDGMFSHDGSIAPLGQYHRLLPKNGLLLVDDAHGAGVLGATGRGTLEQEGVPRDRIIQTVALSKAFGVYGGAILCTTELAKKIMAKSPLFNGNTPLPLPLAWAALRALQTLADDPRLLRQLRLHTQHVKAALQKAHFPVRDGPSPIIQWIPPTARACQAGRRKLLAAGIYPSLIHYGGGPGPGYFRFALSSGHSRQQLDALVKVLVEFA